MSRYVEGDFFEHVSLKNRDGSRLRARRNGRTKLWKTRPSDFRVPIKVGMYGYGYIDHENCDEWEVVG